MSSFSARSFMQIFLGNNSRNLVNVVQRTATVVSCRHMSLLGCDTDNKRVADRFRALPNAHDNVFLTYIWIDGTGQNIRAKTKVVQSEPKSVGEITTWHFDGSSTYQASGGKSDMTLKPVAMCPDPFFVGKSKLVLCEVYDNQGQPETRNWRNSCSRALKQATEVEPWFGMEQEFTLMATNNMPYGFPPVGFPAAQGPYYCSVGAGNSAGRDICDSHMLACRYAGLNHSGTNAEVLLGQWEYQIGPCVGIEMGDQMWFSRYILQRVAEEFGVIVSLDPKPISGDWNGTGMHTNFSTKLMREDGGLWHIWAAVKKLEKRHKEHIAVYDPSGGVDNRRRLTGAHETASIDEFSAAEGSRTVSVRIPQPCAEAGKGWLEDRRPSANADPYAVVDRLIRTCCLNE